MFETLMAAYVLLTLAAVRFTYLEQKKTGVESPVFRLIGYSLCVAWPVTTLLFVSLHAVRRA